MLCFDLCLAHEKKFGGKCLDPGQFKISAKKFPCIECDEIFLSNKERSVHMTTCTGKVGNRVHCD